jgi:uncharacterized repeat protein (TIGR01451 family)
MNQILCFPYGRASALALSLFLATAAQAYVADGPPPALSRNSQPQGPPAAAQAPSPAQQQAARAAAAVGIQIEWSTERGVPLSVRGVDLGQRRAFSGGKGMALSPPDRYEQNALVVLDNLASLYRLRDAGKEFAVKRTDADTLGFHHVRLAQLHQGLRVLGGDLIVHFDRRGDAYQVNGQYVPDLAVNIQPSLTPAQAVERAQQDLHPRSKPDSKLAAEPALVVLASDGEPCLAYELTLTNDGAKAGPERWRCWVDAHKGTVRLRFNDIKHIAPPTADGVETELTGNVLAGEGGQSVSVTGWYQNGGNYYLRNTNRHWLVYNVATNLTYFDPQTYAHRATREWGASDPVEMSLGRNFELVQRYFTEVLGRNSFDNAGIYARANAHVGNNYVNAYWNGVDFSFGDGDGVRANSLAVLDISAHEYTHAVTEETANLTYYSEPGALNESFSDIFGACVEFYAQEDGRGIYPTKSPGKADWLCGEDCWLSSVALRDMRNPRNTATVGAGNQQPSRYRGTYWYNGPADNAGVHYNSGVQNFFFYLLCEGGSGTNDGLAYQLEGIGVSHAERVAYRALTVYCTANMNHQSVRSAWLSAAQDLNPDWAVPVAQAWSAVGINALQVIPGGPLIYRGPAGGPFTPATQSFTLSNRAPTPMDWALSGTGPWLEAAPTSGTIPAMGTAVVDVSLTAAANNLPVGIYTNRLVLTNTTDSTSPPADVKLLIGQPDYLTEVFDAADNDLAFQTWSFIPDGSASFYSVCRNVATDFPTDPTGGTVLTLSDDSFAAITLDGTNTVAIYNRRTNIFFIGSNGYLTLLSGDTEWTESLARHFNLPRVSACFDDLDPSLGGVVSWRQTEELVAVTFSHVRELGSAATVSFQIELFNSGVIRLTYLGIGITDGLAGLSAGQWDVAVFGESDLTLYGACLPPDELELTPATEFASQGYEGGPFLPLSTTYELTNVGPNTINWSAGATSPWLTVTPAAATLSPGTSTSVTVSVTDTALGFGFGVYPAGIRFTNLLSGREQARKAELTVLPATAPTITKQPQGLAVRPRTNVSFCVTASGSLPLSYQWRKDGAVLVDGGRIAGATQPCLTIASVEDGDWGHYSVMVTNAYGAIASADAILLVSALDHFGWSPLPTTQLVGVPFPVTLTALDEWGGAVTNFTGSVSLSGWLDNVPALLYGDSFEDGNISDWAVEAGSYLRAATNGAAAQGEASLTLIGGSESHFDGVSHSLPDLAPVRIDFYMRAAAADQAGGYLVVGRGTSGFAGWAYFDRDGTMDFGGIATENRPPYVANQWYKISIVYDWPHRRLTYLRDDQVIQTSVPFFDESIDSLSDIYLYNYDNTQTWWDDIRCMGGNLSVPVAITPPTSGNCVEGVWTGDLTIHQPVTNVYLLAADNGGHRGQSSVFDVLLANDLSVTLATQPKPLAIGQYLTNCITVSNSGPTTATAVFATNYLPTLATLISATASQGSCTLMGNQVECELGDVPGGAVVTVTTVIWPQLAGELTNVVAVGRAEPDAYPENNSAASVTTAVMPAVSIADESALEDNAGSFPMVFTVRVAPPTAQTVIIAFATTDGTALAGSDFVATNGVLEFLPGETSQTIAVHILGDTNAEPNETFGLVLANPVGGELARALAKGTIRNDDLGPFFDDFDPFLDLTQWSAFGGVPGSTVLATNFGGSVSGPNSLWFGDAGDRFAVSRPLDTVPGGVVDFWLRLAYGGSAIWEPVDLPAEGIVLEFSTDGGTRWVEMGRYVTAVYQTWTHITVAIPVAARQPSTRFRWRQISHSGIDCDHWALDDVSIGLPIPRLVAGSVALLSEGCQPPNLAVDPAETVTLNFELRNFGGLAASNVVATLLPVGGVISLSRPQTFGTLLAGGTASRPFSYVAGGACGGLATPTFQLEADGKDLGTVSFAVRLGSPSAAFSENFDGATAPELPAGWTTTLSGEGSPWAAVTAHSDTPPNAMFVPNPSSSAESSLISPSFLLPAAGGQLSFRHAYSTEGCCDGGQLLISVAGGAFTDILASGGSFVANGYNTAAGWYGTSAGFPDFITTVVNLPQSAWGQPIQLRWRFTADHRIAVEGWYLDSVAVSGGYSCCSSCVTALSAPADVLTTNDLGQCFAAGVSLGVPVLTNANCGPLSVTNDAPTAFPVGVTLVIWTAVDLSGSVVSAPQTVTVRDGELPTLIGPVAVTTTNDLGQCWATGVSLGVPVAAQDNCGLLTVTNDAPAAFPVGTTLVTWRAVDFSGNTTSAPQTVTVGDGEAPTLIAPAAVATNSDSAQNFATGVRLGLPQATNDNCGLLTVTNDAPSVFPLGTTVVTWTAMDLSGNVTTGSQSVTVTYYETPTLISAVLDAGQVRLSFPTLPGRTYLVQAKHALTDSDWQELQTVTGDGSVITVLDPVSGATNRFYRLRWP